MFADLHCHTKMSDGSVCIEELILMAKKIGLKTIAVTDHDTFAGATRAQIIGKRYGIEVIHGAEISAFDSKRNRKVHILCYMCQKPDRLECICKKTSESRREAAAVMLQKIMHFYPISPEMVSNRAKGSTNIFKQHIMHSLMDAGYTMSIYGSLYEKLFDTEKGIANVKVEYPDVVDVIEQIHSARGLAVLAHASIYDSFELMEELLDFGLDGVEVWHPEHSQDDIKVLKEFATDNCLIMTGGSDSHGMYSSKLTKLGAGAMPIDEVEKLKHYCRHKKR